MKKKLLLILTILLLVGCGKKEVNNTTDNLITIKSYDEKFEVTAPDDWTNTLERGELNEAADLEIYNKTDHKYFVALMESKEDITWNFEEYKKFVIEQNEKVYDTTFEEINETTINGKKANYIEFKTTEGNTNIYMRIYLIETDNYYGQLFIWTVYSKRNDLNQEFNKIVESFKEI